MKDVIDFAFPLFFYYRIVGFVYSLAYFDLSYDLNLLHVLYLKKDSVFSSKLHNFYKNQLLQGV